MISPITLANLKPWPEQAEANDDLRVASGCRSMMKCSSGVFVNMHAFSVMVGPAPSGK